jgi:hypothetical protein
VQIAPFDPSKKKKKKKVVIEDLADDSVDKLAEKTENLAGDLLEQQLITVWCFYFQVCYTCIIFVEDLCF